MFRKALIANRGEIACRIARTARRMGMKSVAVYSEADRDALHVAAADEALPIGPAPARDSYLAIDRIIEAALRSGADAVHPGYGFLAENAEFAERCAEAGVTFVGPSAGSMRAMGSKAAAKDLMARIGAPILPGYHGEAQDVATLAEAAARIGFPVLVKASAGGGGRGMRVVREAGELALAVESAAREARGAFGDGRLLIEKYLAHPRHIEIQLFADAHGDVVTFLERDCSLQRSHQKIVEETPAPRLPPGLGEAMRATAATAARASSYVGAGTVEFLVEGEAFYFLEMNTRLQVEHPVTEMICGLDLVEWQFRVAAGEPLPLRQEQIRMRGCAIEARICAENPARNFLPATGLVAHLRFPPENAELRIDSGVRQGDRVSPHYDSLLAKLVVRDEDRAGAVRKLQNALGTIELAGVPSNLDFLRGLSREPRFLAGDYDTRFVEGLAVAPAPPSQEEEGLLLAAAAAAWRDDAIRRARRGADESGDPRSPWSAADAWRLYAPAAQEVSFRLGERLLSGRLRPLAEETFRIDGPSGAAVVRARRCGDRMSLFLDGARRELGIVDRPEGYVVILDGCNHVLEFVDPLAPPARSAAREKALAAPLPARVTRIFVKPGDHVEKGAPLLVLEAMKMEITVTAPRKGEIEKVLCDEGQAVLEGADLIRLGAAP